MQITPDMKITSVKDCANGEIILGEGEFAGCIIFLGTAPDGRTRVKIAVKNNSAKAQRVSDPDRERVVSLGADFIVKVDTTACSLKTSGPNYHTGWLCLTNRGWEMFASMSEGLLSYDLKSKTAVFTQNEPDFTEQTVFPRWSIYPADGPGKDKPIFTFDATAE